MSRKKSMKKKLAVAMSVVNALNAVTPMALPYVNVSRDMSTAGGQTCDLGGVHFSLSCSEGVAHAEEVDLDVSTLNDGETQSVGDGQTGTVGTMNGGTQKVMVSGTGTVETMNGGTQDLDGGSGTVSSMSGGTQVVGYGGRGTVSSMSGGTQELLGGGNTGTIEIMRGGKQSIGNGDTGTVSTMSNGWQEVHIHGNGTIETMSNGMQTVEDMGTGTVSTMIGGQQHVSNGGTGIVSTMNGGTQIVESGGTGNVGSMSGGVLDMRGGITSVRTVYRGVTFIISSLPQDAPAISVTDQIDTNTVVDISGLDLGTEERCVTLMSAVNRIDAPILVYSGGTGKVSTYIYPDHPFVEVKSTDLTEKPNNYLTASCQRKDTVSLEGDQNVMNYTIARTPYTQVTVSGAVPWNTSAPLVSSLSSSTFDAHTQMNLGGLSFSVTDETAGKLCSGAVMDLIASGVTSGTISTQPEAPSASYEGRNTKLSAAVAGEASIADNALKYTVSSVTLDKVTVTSVGETADAVPAGWTAKEGGVDVDTNGMTVPDLAAGTERDILTASGNLFGNAKITGANKYTEGVSVDDTKSGVTLTGSQSRGVKASTGGDKLVYAVSDMNVSSISLGEMTWGTGRTMGTSYDFTNAAVVDASGLKFTNPEAVSGSMTILSGAVSLPSTLGSTGISSDYSYSPVSGVTISGHVKGDISSADAKITYTATENKASSLTFTNVEWKDTGALIAHAADGTKNIDFNGAAVDTTKIYFTNVQSLHANQKMTLVSSFGTSVGTISGTEYTVGTTLKGRGKASLSGSDLIYTVETDSKAVPSGGGSSSGGGNSGGGSSSGGGSTSNGGSGTNSGSASTGKTTTVSGMETSGNVSGSAATGSNPAKNDTANVTGSTVKGSVTGATSQNGAAEGNTAKVTDSTVTGDVAGAHSESGDSSSNKASVENTSVEGNVTGGSSENGAAESNEASVSGDSHVKGNVYGGRSENGTASGNTVNVTGGTVEGYAFGGKSAKESSHNNVDVSNGTVGGIIGGGCLTAENNTVNIGGDAKVIEHVYGAKADESATENTVNVTGGTIGGNVYGGYGASVKANSNTVNLSGGTVLGAVYGGYSESGVTENNVVKLYGSANLSAANLYGGNRGFTGNTLIIGDASSKTAWTGGGQSVRNLANFENLSFDVVPWSGSTAALTITDGTASDLSGTHVSAKNVCFTNTDSLNSGNSMTLLDATSVTDSGKKLSAGNLVTASNYTVGTTGEGTGTLSLDKKGNVIYTVNTSAGGTPIVTAQEQTHNTVMGMEAGLAVLAAGNGFIGKAAEGLGDAANRGEDGISVFAAMGGGQSRYETGSHVKANTWGGIVAVGARNELSNGTLEWGGFVEHGSGNFTLYSETGYGSGSSNYTGGGLLAKWQNKQDVYTEASLRMGRMHDTASDILRDALGGSYGYNVHADYYGGHVGIGKIYRFDGGRSLDVYGKFFVTKRNGVSFDAGGHYDLDSVTSNVLRIGARYSSTGARWNWYGGLAYEYEFDGEAGGTADGARIRSASIRGSSLMAELGIRMEPTAASPWKMDIGLTGHAGKHKGMGGAVSVAYMF